MNDKLESVKCRCGGEAYVDTLAQIMGVSKPWFRVVCDKCEIQTDTYDTETEAITVWNRVMGERTAKVASIEKPIIGDAEGKTIKVTSCGNCESTVSIFDNYCPVCGARLEWK